MAGLEEIKNEENIPIEEVFQSLKCSRQGLSSEEAEARLAVFGPNKLEEKKESKILKFLGFMWNPLSWVMETTAIMAIALANGGGKPLDWQDFVGIESNTRSAAEELMANLAPKAKVLRDDRWSEQDAAVLAPGDIISIKLGDIIPADARLLEGDPLKIDQSALIGESLPGEIEAVVIATGVHTLFGKAAHLVDSTNQMGHFQKVLKSIGNFCIVAIAIGIVIEVIVMYAIQHRRYRDGIDNLLVLLIGGIPIAMPTHRLATQGAITKRMTAIEEMASMTALCSDKTGTLTINKLSVDRRLIEIFVKGVNANEVILLAARSSRVENQDAIDAAMVGMLGDPKEAREGIKEVHFLPFNPVDKRTALTYIDLADGSCHRVSKGTPEQIMTLCNCKEDVKDKVHAIIDKYAERGLRSLAVARQKLPEKSKDSPGGPWEFVALLPLFDPPRHDSAETIKKALNLGVNVKMITVRHRQGDGQEAGVLGMGTNMYPSSALLGQCKDEAIASIPVDDLIEKADGFAGVFPGESTPLSSPIYAVSITIRIVLGFMLIALICKFDFSPFMILVIAILNDGTIMTISKDRVRPSPHPDSWKLNEIFVTGVVYGTYLAVMTVIFFWAMRSTDFFTNTFGVRSLHGSQEEMMSALYLQVSIISQALIFVTRSRGLCFTELPGFLLCVAFVVAQIIATLVAVIPTIGFAHIRGIGWGWAGVIWLYSVVTFLPLDVFKFAIRYALSGKAWDTLFEHKIAFTTKKDYGREEREAQWATAQRTLHGLQMPELAGSILSDRTSYRELSEIAEQAKRRAEVARLRELSTLKGQMESVVKLKSLDREGVQQHYTV
ncbi:unnamed protein product [Miscanthus lutarioriparius]|uniref:Cation-transporting P-type ATPase N-terminal domain-containing protein n=1 Tax=Miscanthus lutarioriparius TaxID=422564 RepID=A0A811PWQ2_9POAL|nr:unnamed protein product [Miscanthus lutarioriparius]